MFIYNLSLYTVFFTMLQYFNRNYKTLYSFTELGSSNFFSKILIIALFSMAGVPPFLGFFSKVFIFTLLCNSNFFLFFPFFFILLFIGLYFYIQNIRFLNSTSTSDFTPIVELNVRSNPLYYSIILFFTYLTVFGFFYTEDLILSVFWVLF